MHFGSYLTISKYFYINEYLTDLPLNYILHKNTKIYLYYIYIIYIYLFILCQSLIFA